MIFFLPTLVWSACAVRRGAQQDVDKGLEHVKSLIEQRPGPGTANMNVLRSLVQSAVTPGMTGNLTTIIQQLEHNVVQKIIRDNNATQEALKTAVEVFREGALISRAYKDAADTSDRKYHECVQIEEVELNKIIDDQATADQAGRAQVEPCAREAGSSSFSTIEHPIVFTCDLSTDDGCESAMTEFKLAIEASMKRIESVVAGNISYHNQAQTDCTIATNNLVSAKNNVTSKQRAWEQQKSVCVSAEVDRNLQICSFGERLQTACEQLTHYQAEKAKVQSTGTDYSVEDRKREYNATQLVLCLLRDFVHDSELKEAEIEACGNVNTDFLTVDVLSSEVEDIRRNGTFKIKCQMTEDVEFHETYKNAPDAQILPVYELYSDSVESANLKSEYSDENGRTETFTWNNVDNPFAVCSPPTKAPVIEYVPKARCVNQATATYIWGPTEEECRHRCDNQVECLGFIHYERHMRCVLVDNMEKGRYKCFAKVQASAIQTA